MSGKIEKYTFTFDVESDWGGRANSYNGVKVGIPKILSALSAYDIKGLFFVSTEILRECRNEIYMIKESGHEIGSHGHFHIKYDKSWRASQDRGISEILLETFRRKGQAKFKYRAPKFSWIDKDEPYSNPKNHIGLLKYMWFGGRINKDTIFYIHPFDIVGGSNPPNLFCRLWYSKPEDAYETFINWLKWDSRSHTANKTLQKVT